MSSPRPSRTSRTPTSSGAGRKGRCGGKESTRPTPTPRPTRPGRRPTTRKGRDTARTVEGRGRAVFFSLFEAFGGSFEGDSASPPTQRRGRANLQRSTAHCKDGVAYPARVGVAGYYYAARSVSIRTVGAPLRNCASGWGRCWGGRGTPPRRGPGGPSRHSLHPQGMAPVEFPVGSCVFLHSVDFMPGSAGFVPPSATPASPSTSMGQDAVLRRVGDAGVRRGRDPARRARRVARSTGWSGARSSRPFFHQAPYRVGRKKGGTPPQGAPRPMIPAVEGLVPRPQHTSTPPARAVTRSRSTVRIDTDRAA